MTVSTTYAPIQYTGNGVTTVFSFPYAFYSATDLIVTLTLISSGANTIQVLNTDYTVTGGNGAAGSITMTVPPSALFRLTIEMSLPYTQLDDYVENQAFPSETLESGLDRAALRDQQLANQLGRGLTFPATLSGSLVGRLPQPVNNQLLAWDGTGGTVKGVSIATLDPLPVMFTSLASGDLLTYNGTNWVNSTSVVLSVTASQTTTYNATIADDVVRCSAGAAPFTVNLYTAVGNAGRQITIVKTDSSFNVVTIDANGSETINGNLTRRLATQFEHIVLVSDGANWIIMERYIPTDWQVYTATITHSSGGMTNGTTSALYRRVGGDIEVMATTAFGAASAAFTGYAISLPSGLTVDTGRLSNVNAFVTQLGWSHYLDIGVASFTGTVLYNTTTTMLLQASNAAGTYLTNNSVTNTIPFTYGANDAISCVFKCPITNWES